MTFPTKRSSRSGFTLVELMLSSVILLVAIAGWSSLNIAQTKLYGQGGATLNLATITDAALAEVSAGPAMFPPIEDPSTPGTYLVYVMCLNKKGLAVPAKNMPNTTSGTGDTGLGYRLFPLSWMGNNVKQRVTIGGQPYCDAGVELHLRYRATYNMCAAALQIEPHKTQSGQTYVAKAMAHGGYTVPNLSIPVDTTQMMSPSTTAEDPCAGPSAFTTSSLDISDTMVTNNN